MERIENIATGVELCFLDKRQGGLRLCGRLYSQEKQEELTYLFNGEKRTVSMVNCTEINDTFRHIFYVEISYEDIKSPLTIDFGRLTRSSHFFPIELELNGYYVTDNIILYNEGTTLIFAPVTKELLRKRKKKYKVFRFNKTSLIAFALRIAHKLSKIFHKKDLWLISDRLDKAGDNGQAFFEYIVNHTPTGVRPVFVLDKKSSDYKKIKRLGKVISPKSPMYKLHYLRAKMNISSQLDGSRLLKVRPYLKDIMNESRVIFLQHGVIEHDSSSYYNRFDFGMDMFVTTTKGEYDSIVGIKNYGCDDKIVSLCGLCRYDKLENKRENIIFICPTWRLSLLESTETLELKEGYENSAYFKFFSSLLSNEKLINKAQEKGYKLCFYPHRMLKNLKKHLTPTAPCFMDGEGISYTEMFKRGALLLTDYSSVQFDFSYLKKPVVYCQFDREEFFSSHTCQEGYMEYERDGLGPVTYDLDTTVDTLCAYMENDCRLEEKYRERIDKTFKFTDRDNCERTFNRIMEIYKG